jgi:putative FmdB family regulatory protein
MPIYEYDCAEHGVFEVHRAVADFAAPGVCPACGRSSMRVLSPPRLRCTPATHRIANERNERSQHEPKVVARPATSPRNAREGGSPGVH